jgi:TatA/E family protein of Tat protein translocase
VILAVVALVLFGGARIAGLGKGAGRAIREFKEETSSLRTELAGAARVNPDNDANAD